MKKYLLIALAACTSVLAQAPPNGFGPLIGYKAFELDDAKFFHDTHPGDSFLPNSNISGSAGSTQVGGLLHFAALGARYHARLSDAFALTIDGGDLIGGDRDEHQNQNDSRSSGSGSFVYSEARFGVFAALGARYHIKSFFFGGEAQLAGIYVEHGRDRFDDDERNDSEYEFIPSAGPTTFQIIGVEMLVPNTF